MSKINLAAVLLALLCQSKPTCAEEVAKSNRIIEEIIVTADRQKSTVQKTNIAVTAINELMMEQYGIRNQEDIQNYIPSIVVQPYDIAIRGVGRNFLSLGGDPGVATYVDNVYEEYFIGAAAQNGLYDLERIEVLRGPQGTLYGRNGIGGAVNFINNKPEHQFSAEVRALFGNYNVKEYYGYVTGPLIEDKLAGRFVFADRTGDGYISDLSGNGDLDATDDKSFTMSFTFDPTESLHFYLRGSTLRRDRAIAGASGITIANAIVVGENGGFADEINGYKRNTSARVFGLRRVNPSIACLSLIDRNTPDCAVPNQHIFEYNAQGLQRFAQRVVPGVDTAATHLPNYLFQHDSNLVNATVIGDGRTVPEINGSDLNADTNGLNFEKIDRTASSLIAEWTLSDSVSLRYIFGYTEWFYERDLDVDNSSSDAFQQLYANQENESFQHEIQLFADIGDNFHLTTGLFYYESHIDQRSHIYGGLGGLSGPAYGTNPFNGQPFTGSEVSTLLFGGPIISTETPGLFTARDTACQNFEVSSVPLNLGLESLIRESVVTECAIVAFRSAEDISTVNHGPQTRDVAFQWDNTTHTQSRAIFGQLEWEISDRFSLMVGARWAKDEKQGLANTWVPFEIALNDIFPGLLLIYNQITGALDADGNPTDIPGNFVRYQGFPAVFNFHRELFNEWTETTWRLNLDYLLNDSTLIYATASTGYRSGGYNLGNLSALPAYDPETLLSYELGLKTLLFDGRFRLNAALYRYDYEDIHIQFPTAQDAVDDVSLTATGRIGTRNAPAAINQGLEIETIWLATDELELGLNYSYADATYTKEVIDPRTGGPGVVDNNNPDAPIGIYSLAERRIPIKGRRLLHIPKDKVSAHLKYTLPFSTGTLEVISTYSWIGKVVFDISAGPLETAPSWQRLDIRVGWQPSNRRWSVTGFVHNVTNEIGIRDLGTGDVATNYARAATTTVPRFAGIDMRYRFGAN